MYGFEGCVSVYKGSKLNFPKWNALYRLFNDMKEQGKVEQLSGSQRPL